MQALQSGARAGLLLPRLARRVPMTTVGPFPTLLPACAAAAFTQPSLPPGACSRGGSTLHVRALAGTPRRISISADGPYTGGMVSSAQCLASGACALPSSRRQAHRAAGERTAALLTTH